MRTRSWRRYKEQLKVKKRLKDKSNYHTIINANGYRISSYNWTDQIGTSNHYMFKTYTTDRVDTNYKSKYGKSGFKDKCGDKRVKDKVLFKKMLESDYGIKHLNISYGFT